MPEFYDHEGDQVPLRWLARIKHALETPGWRYNSDRIVMDYARDTYVLALRTATSRIID